MTGQDWGGVAKMSDHASGSFFVFLVFFRLYSSGQNLAEEYFNAISAGDEQVVLRLLDGE